MKPIAKIIVISSFLAFCNISLTNELLVPSQYPTIQSAINAASDFEKLAVAQKTVDSYIPIGLIFLRFL